MTQVYNGGQGVTLRSAAGRNAMVGPPRGVRAPDAATVPF
ncbi:hypothetical protein APY04_1276 [Hyphomicrobium sulfonivorans]|uniref:Uncharacterized protein n=1 Tax=Hyphomicrobium sulfonivorans TaxID=121290 RepID=A0A109BLB3_HYPSL|nr:hypothetical protein APY04_1276 [Hyphomicrobium sulfonivorans]